MIEDYEHTICVSTNPISINNFDAFEYAKTYKDRMKQSGINLFTKRVTASPEDYGHLCTYIIVFGVEDEESMINLNKQKAGGWYAKFS